MVPRPFKLSERLVEIFFNDLLYSVLEIDLEHINLGKSRTRNSDFTITEVVNIAVNFLDGDSKDMTDERIFGEYFCQYYVFKKDYRYKKYKMVVCICSDKPERIGIITLHRI